MTLEYKLSGYEIMTSKFAVLKYRLSNIEIIICDIEYQLSAVLTAKCAVLKNWLLDIDIIICGIKVSGYQGLT